MSNRKDKKEKPSVEAEGAGEDESSKPTPQKKKGNSRPKKKNVSKGGDFSGSGPPKPKALSTEETPFRNDPLGHSIFEDPTVKIKPVPGTSRIFPEATGLTVIVKEEYQSLAARSNNLLREIPLSCYSYYACCLVWRRLLSVSSSNHGTLSADELNFLEKTKIYNPPTTLGLYLAGIGNTAYLNGVVEYKASIKKPSYLEVGGISGYFGPIQQNLAKYCNYPSLGVAFQRIRQDLAHNAAAQNWDLPAGVAWAGHLPSLACIGYAPSQQLSPLATSTITACEIGAGEFESDCSTLPLSVPLLNEVQSWIDEIPNIKVIAQPTTNQGSRAQLMCSRIGPEPPDILQASWQTTSAQRFTGGVENAGATFLYRVDKSAASVVANTQRAALCPVILAAGDEYPDINELRNAEHAEVLNTVTEGISPFTRQLQRLAGILKSDFG